MYSEITVPAFRTEQGILLENIKIAYHTFGELNTEKSNVIWVCHALTANSNVFEWWQGLFGIQELFNPKEHFIVCANVLGSCYGSSGPVSYEENKGFLLSDFPAVTIRDMVRAHLELSKRLNINFIQVLIGASLGGQQALEWSIIEPEMIRKLVLIATNAKHSAYGIAFNESQRLAIHNDPTYGKELDGGKSGLSIARSIAMLSYRTYDGYNFTRQDDSKTPASYQRYQGQKLAQRFSAYSYVLLSGAMDSHDVGRNRGSIKKALKGIKAQTLVISIDSDVLFPPKEQLFIAENIDNADYVVVKSVYGHDGFLIETEQLSMVLGGFLKDDYRSIRFTSLKKIKNRITQKIN